MNTLESTGSVLTDLDAEWISLADNAPGLALKGAGCTLCLYLRAGRVERYIQVVNGRVIGVKAGPRTMHRSDISFVAPDSVWQTFWSAMPPPEFHDIFALSSFGHMTISGDTDKLLTHLGFVKHLLGLPRVAFANASDSLPGSRS